METKDLLRVTGLLYQAAGEPAHWEAALTSLADTLRSGHALVGVRGESQPPLLCGARIDTPYLERMPRLLEGSPYQRLFVAAPVGVAFPDAEFVDYDVLERSDFYQQVIRPFRSTMSQSFIAVCRSRRSAWYTTEERRAMQALIPHAEAALRLHSKLAQAHEGLWTRETILDGLDIGVALVDRHLRPLLLNAKARALMRQRDGIGVGAAGLYGASNSLTSGLQRVIAAAIDPARTLSVAPTLRLDRPSGKPPYVIRVMPVGTRHPLLDRCPATSAIVFIDTAEGQRLRPALLTAWFGLTPKEAQLAVLLAEGNDLRASSARMNVKLETVRTHLQSLFAKTHTRRQAELVSVLLRTAWRL
jgi:DNA-binding CsgD family transcriptional regulator